MQSKCKDAKHSTFRCLCTRQKMLTALIKKKKKGGGGREADEDGEGLLRGPSQTLPLVGQRCPHPRQKRTAGKWCPTSDRKFQAVSPARRRLFL